MKSSRQAVFRKLAILYDRMQAEYSAAAQALGLSCQGCEKNCCLSHFQHHTYVEWLYLWQGLKELPEERRAEYVRRAHENVEACRASLTLGRTPAVMCPLNDDGLCGLYAHRLMICRLHGVPNLLRRPDGREMRFPGCWQAQELSAGTSQIPVMDRTPLYRELLGLEAALLGKKLGKLPKVDLTLAEMIVAGPPDLV
ncbi:hypothetical protein [Desulfocurvibacter africanus]|uniref:hypothetical protein n=1 Tax=Desulfocurvibacter africanus TaxID=873 RepID=UPI0004277695|nr:hypothetical protein [Desulfocurvibacter africanus]